MTIDFKGLSEKLYSAVLSDVLDSFGYRNQAMRPFVRPSDESKVIFGRARTGGFMNIYSVTEGENPYALEIALIDDLKPGDVAVLGCDGPTTRIAPWGELLSTASSMRGAVGCVTDGLVRDLRQIREMGFPVFHGGVGPLDSNGRGKMTTMDQPIECGGVLIHSGDLVFGDIDGVVVIPQKAADEILAAALAKVAAEDHTRREIIEGKLLQEVYDKYGVL
ncbi:RraA family protein [Pikeienuella sp. HZG-20]|uniref:RraA family protein n=1 Tax=Paludibacillus litoralis TaxID=3133267 RepID=UPI0030EB1858